MNADLQAVRDVVTGASLAVNVRQSVLGGIDQLPALYDEFRRTYDIRHRDGIARRIEAMLYLLREDQSSTAAARRVADGIVAGLETMHQRLGIPSLGLKRPTRPTPPKRPAKAKT